MRKKFPVTLKLHDALEREVNPHKFKTILRSQNANLFKKFLGGGIIEDPDESIFDQVKGKLIEMGPNVIPQLENGSLELSDHIPSWVSHFHVSRSYYNNRPEEFSAYLQDKVEYGDMIINMGMVSGLLPVTGLPVPFISYGGSFFLTCSIIVGLINNIVNNHI